MDSKTVNVPGTPASLRLERLSERAWLIAGVVLLANSILRGIRAPGRWAYTELLFNYDFGFSKRALQGAILSIIGTPSLYHYSFCFWYDLTILFINVGLLTALLRDLCNVGESMPRLVALVFSSSLAVVVLAHTIGYGDQIALLVTLLTLRTREFYARSMLVALLFPACLLIHETEFVLFFPVILFRFLVDIGDGRDRAKLISLCTIIVCALATLVSLTYSKMSVTDAAQMYHAIQSKADYPLREDELFMITSTFGDNLRVQLKVWRDPDAIRFFLYCFVVTFPTTLYLLRETLTTLSATRARRFLRLAAVAASLSPLSMYAIGVDANRWTTLATTTSFLVFSIVVLHSKVSQSTPASPLVVPAFLIAMNLGSTIELFDGYVVQNFPYEEHLDDLSKVISGSAPFPPRPELCVESGCVTVFDWPHPVSAVAKKSSGP